MYVATAITSRFYMGTQKSALIGLHSIVKHSAFTKEDNGKDLPTSTLG